MVGTRTPYRAGVDGRVSPVVWVLLEEPVVVEPGDVVPEEPDPTPVPPVGATYAAEVESMVEALPEVADELAVEVEVAGQSELTVGIKGEVIAPKAACGKVLASGVELRIWF